MSDWLADPALGDAGGGPSVEDTAPAATAEVGGSSDSTGSDEMIPASRFNGLMASFNKAKDEAQSLSQALAEREQRIQALEAELNNSRGDAYMSDSATLDQIEEMRALLVEQRMKEARKEVFQEFPDAVPFADLLNTNDPEQLRELARAVSERVASLKPAPNAEPAAPAVQESAAPVAPAVAPDPDPPVSAGGSTFSAPAAVQDRIAAAVKNRDLGEFMRAKSELSQLGQ